MELEILLKHLLPEELSKYFDLVEVKETEDDLLSLFLDEKKLVPQELKKQQIVSHGFTEPVTIQDFPLRGKRVYLIVRRRKWKDTVTGKIYSKTWDITAKGTSYSQEFAAFLKEVFR
jgi:hypothetical protein